MTSSPPAVSLPHRRVWHRNLAIGLLVLAVALIAFRLALPSILYRYVNRTLNHVGEYHGEVGQIRVHLWRGAYQIQDVRLVKESGKVPVPFFTTDVLDLSVSWGAILHGAFVGKVILKHPTLNFVASSEGGAQTSIDSSWQEQFKKLFPLKFDQVTIENGEIFFHNYTSNPPVNLKLDHVNAVATNLTNSHHLSKTLVTTIEAKGRAMDAAQFHATIHSDVFQKPPSFALQLGLDALPLEKLNDFFKAYANVTAKGGTFALYTEINSDHGNFNGYLKPLLDQPKFFDLSKEHDPGAFIWDGLVELFTQLLKNQPNDRFATQIPVSGSVHDMHLGFIDAVINVFRNAFIQVFVPGFNQLVHPADAQDQAQGKTDQPVKVEVKDPPPVQKQ